MISETTPIRFFNLRRSLSAIVFLTLVLIAAIFAASGDLDPTFSVSGKLTDFIPGQDSNYFTATIVQPDGKIVAVGNTSEHRYIYVARYNSNGSPDTTFGGGTGKAAVQFGRFYNSVADVALQPDGKIMLAGCYCEEDSGDYQLALGRLNSDGSLDASFGFNGIVTRPDIRWRQTPLLFRPTERLWPQVLRSFPNSL
jgi:uncharacterized delta-60 repeat protein